MDPESQNPDHVSTQRNSETSQPAHFVTKLRQNLDFKSKWGELNGATGDLGTFIPIILALTLAKNLDLGTTLIFTGIYNFVTGAIYGVPLPVQPMKSIAAVAISDASFGIPEVMAAGILTGAVLMFLGVTGLMRLVYKVIPISVVRGIQLAQGLSFAMTAATYIRNEQNFAKSEAVGSRPWLGLDGMLLAVVCACFIVIVSGSGEEHVDRDDDNDTLQEERTGGRTNRKTNLRKIIASLPSAFIIFLLGVVLAIIRGHEAIKSFKFGPSKMELTKFTKRAWREGFVKGAIPQLPLTVLNSVISVCQLSTDLFPEKEVSATSVSITVGLMNLTGCWFGVMPCCHGAGGLAGQYKFGGRTGACVALLGVAELVLGLVLGSSLVKILDQFPVGVLGVLLLFAGIELAMCTKATNSKADSFVMLICTAVSLVGSSAALGFLCGMVVYFLLRLRRFERGQSLSMFWLGRE